MRIEGIIPAVILGMLTAPAIAQPLQGGVSQDDYAGQAEYYVSRGGGTAEMFYRGSRQRPPLTGRTEGGQDEYWVDWNAWRRRVHAAIYNYVQDRGLTLWNYDKITYAVTRDGRIFITKVKSFDPLGKRCLSGRLCNSKSCGMIADVSIVLN